MRTKAILSFIFLFCISIFSSCNKDNPQPEPGQDNGSSGDQTENTDGNKEDSGDGNSEQPASALIIEDGILKGILDKSMTSIILPDNVIAISEKAFENSSVIEATLNEGIEALEKNCFAKSKIKKINFPSTLKVIGNDAFLDCFDLEEVDLSKTKIETINEYAFYGTGVKKVTLPETLASIEDLGFAETPNLTEIVVPKNVKTIGMQAFYKSGITKATFNNNIERLGYMAFGDCKKLTSVTAEGEYAGTDGVLDTGCFQNCIALKEISIPECFSIIKDDIFIECESLKKIILPKSIKEIGSRALVTNHDVETIIFKVKNAPELKSENKPGEIVNVFPAFFKKDYPEYNDINEIIIPGGSTNNYKDRWDKIFEKYKSIIKEDV